MLCSLCCFSSLCCHCQTVCTKPATLTLRREKEKSTSAIMKGSNISGNHDGFVHGDAKLLFSQILLFLGAFSEVWNTVRGTPLHMGSVCHYGATWKQSSQVTFTHSPAVIDINYLSADCIQFSVSGSSMDSGTFLSQTSLRESVIFPCVTYAESLCRGG